MAHLTILKNLGLLENIPVVKVSELVVDKKYPILQVKKVKTKYDQQLLATISDDGKTIKIYLPQRFVKQLTSAILDTINKGYTTLIYKGVNDSGANILDFEDSDW